VNLGFDRTRQYNEELYFSPGFCPSLLSSQQQDLIPSRRIADHDTQKWVSSLLEIKLLSLHRCVFGQRGVMCIGSRVQG